MLSNCGAGEDLRVLWPARRSNQSILKEINPEYSLERLVLKWKLQYFGHMMQRANSLEKTLMLRKIEGMRRRGKYCILTILQFIKMVEKECFGYTDDHNI